MSDFRPEIPTDFAASAEFPKAAGFLIRLAASFIDGIFFAPLSVLGFFALTSAYGLPLMILLGIPGLFYKPFMESYHGATLGKMACGIRVINRHGRRLSIGEAYLRFSPF